MIISFLIPLSERATYSLGTMLMGEYLKEMFVKRTETALYR